MINLGEVENQDIFRAIMSAILVAGSMPFMEENKRYHHERREKSYNAIYQRNSPRASIE